MLVNALNSILAFHYTMTSIKGQYQSDKLFANKIAHGINAIVLENCYGQI